MIVKLLFLEAPITALLLSIVLATSWCRCIHQQKMRRLKMQAKSWSEVSVRLIFSNLFRNLESSVTGKRAMTPLGRKSTN